MRYGPGIPHKNLWAFLLPLRNAIKHCHTHFERIRTERGALSNILEEKHPNPERERESAFVECIKQLKKQFTKHHKNISMWCATKHQYGIEETKQKSQTTHSHPNGKKPHEKQKGKKTGKRANAVKEKQQRQRRRPKKTQVKAYYLTDELKKSRRMMVKMHSQSKQTVQQKCAHAFLSHNSRSSILERKPSCAEQASTSCAERKCTPIASEDVWSRKRRGKKVI